VYRWSFLLVVVVVALWVAPVSAQSATHVDVYARGLVNPKGMVFAPDGVLYVAESGKPGEVMVPLPVNFGGSGPIGTNARVSRISAGGQRQDFVTGLPNVGLYGGIEMLGATGMAMLNGALFELAAGHITVSPALSRVTPDGKLQTVADIGAYNRAHPVPGDNGDAVPMGNPFDVVALGGNLYVTGPKGIWVWDASGNHLGTIVIPEQPANLTWGGKDYRTLYITATTSVYRLEMKKQGFVPYLEH